MAGAQVENWTSHKNYLGLKELKEYEGVLKKINSLGQQIILREADNLYSFDI